MDPASLMGPDAMTTGAGLGAVLLGGGEEVTEGLAAVPLGVTEGLGDAAFAVVLGAGLGVAAAAGAAGRQFCTACA